MQRCDAATESTAVVVRQVQVYSTSTGTGAGGSSRSACLSPIFYHFLILLVCTAVDPSTEYCYDNPIADVTMYGGHPKYKSIYGFLDWYTWSGWFEALGFHIMMASLKELVVMMVVVGTSVGYLMTNTGTPFCLAGDFKVGFSFAYYDLCDNVAFLSATA